MLNNSKLYWAKKSFEDAAQTWKAALTRVKQGKGLLTEEGQINLCAFIDKMIKFNHTEWYSTFYALLPESNTTALSENHPIADRAYFWNKIIEKSLEYKMDKDCQTLPSGKKEYSAEKSFYSAARAIMQVAHTSEEHRKLFNDAADILAVYFKPSFKQGFELDEILLASAKHCKMLNVLRSATQSSYISTLHASFDITCSHDEETYPDIYIETQKGPIVFHGLSKADVAQNGLKACINVHLKAGLQSFETRLTGIFNNPNRFFVPTHFASLGEPFFLNHLKTHSITSESDKQAILKDISILSDQICKDVEKNSKFGQVEAALVAMDNAHAPLLNLFKEAGRVALVLQSPLSDAEWFISAEANSEFCSLTEYKAAWMMTLFNNNNRQLQKTIGPTPTLCAEKLSYNALLGASVAVANSMLHFSHTPVIQTILKNHKAKSINELIEKDKSGIANDILLLLDVCADAKTMNNTKVLSSIKRALENPKYAEPDQLQKLTKKAILKLHVVATHSDKQPLNDTQVNRDYTA